MGKQRSTIRHQTGQMLAALLDWPQAVVASKLELGRVRPRSRARSTAGWKSWDQLPASSPPTARLNTPRYATLPNIMKAKKKPSTW